MLNLRKSFLMGGVAAGAALVGSAFFSILVVQAACTNPATIPTGFAAPCPVFSLSATTVTQAQTLTLSATPQAGTDYIYTTAYVSQGTAWNPYTLQGNNAYPSYSSALASLTLSSTQLQALSLGTHYAVVWDWLWDNTAQCYKGPGLNQCNTGSWRVQSFSLTSSATPTPSPTPTYTYSQSSYYAYSQSAYTGGTNVAPQGTAYRWHSNTVSTADTNKVAAAALNDNDLTVDVNLNGATYETLTAFEAGGVVWTTPQTLASVKFINGTWLSSQDGGFDANLTLQTTNDGTTWVDSPWTVSPAYAYNSSAVSGVTYTFSGSAVSVLGVRVSGQVHTITSGSSYWENMREVQAFTGGGSYTYSQSSYYAYSQSSYTSYTYSQSSYYVYSQSAYYAYSQAAYTSGALIDPSRSIDWSNAGATIQNRTTLCATTQCTALNTPANVNAANINAAIASAAANTVVLLPAGTFNLSTGILFNNKSNVTLRGAGSNQTFLVISAPDPCIGLNGADVCLRPTDSNDAWDGPTNLATWTGGYSVGTNSITLGSISKGGIGNLQIGSLLFLDQLDDTSDTGNVYVCQTSGVCATDISVKNGRLNRGQDQPQIVTSISGSGPWTIGITPGIRMPNIRSSQSPEAYWDNGQPIQGDGIEDLSINHTSSNGTGAGIFIFGGRNNWVKNVRDYSTVTNGIHKHVWMYQAIHTTVRDSYFYGGGDGGNESYGLDTYNGADNLYENNIFQHMATGMMNEGCIGCAEAYNYAVDDYYYGNSGTAPDWQQGSSYHHSLGNAFILFEGNEGIGFTADNVHGTSNFLTAFRNYWNGRDPALTLGVHKDLQTVPVLLYTHSRYYNIVGNVLGTSGYHTNYTSSPTASGNCETSIYALGWGGNCGSGSTPNDNLVSSTIMRWGNYDTVNAANRFVASEVPSGLSLYANPVPASQTLPASLYLSAKPSFWGTQPYPAIGPDVTAGNIANLGGHAYHIPAGNCYLSVMGGKTDGSSGVLAFSAASCYP